MDRGYSENLDLNRVPTPCFVIDEGKLKYNLKILDDVQKRSGCKILLALKAFAMFSVFPLLRKTLKGICASSPHEARLGYEEFRREVHSFAAAYSETDIKELIPLSDHIVFNSFAQWNRFRSLIEKSGRKINCGIRVNPEHSEGQVSIYDPCAPGSRLGVRLKDFDENALPGISGLHFHTLCEQNSDALDRTLKVFEEKFGQFLYQMQWVNFGGGHHITRSDYDVDLLCNLIIQFRKKYDLTVYLEPGEAVALNAGILVASVLDIVDNHIHIAILDTSATAHMPDVLEMPYRPEVVNAGMPGQRAYTYRLGGLSCLAGDIIGDYSFDEPLKIGTKIVFLDMAHYTMVKTTTFNGVKLPSIALYKPENDKLEIIRSFTYEDYKTRLS
ncbi:MAG: carboxynorspermidine decarboxylase [Desulfobacterales bacterium]|nr:carboxynorspermidine decarboxylase [Desulfobacterales bacterium]